MLHTVFCILFTLHQRPGTLRGTAVLRVVMNSNQRGGNGKSWVLSLWQMGANIYQTYTEILETEQTPVNLPRCEARRYIVETIAVNFENSGCSFTPSHEVKEKSEGKGHFFFSLLPQTVRTAGLAKCSGCEPATRTKQVTTRLSC